MKDEENVKHLEMIQAVISRMAGNSFAVKGWSITLVSVLAGFAAKDANAWFAGVAFLPALCFWGLDAYYLRQERLFVAVYRRVGANLAAAPTYSMDTTTSDVDTIGAIAVSPTVLAVHGPIVAAVALVLLYAWKV